MTLNMHMSKSYHVGLCLFVYVVSMTCVYVCVLCVLILEMYQLQCNILCNIRSLCPRIVSSLNPILCKGKDLSNFWGLQEAKCYVWLAWGTLCVNSQMYAVYHYSTCHMIIKCKPYIMSWHESD